MKRDISLKRNRVSLSLVLFFSLRVPIEILFIKTPKKEVKRVEEESLKRYLVKQKRELFLSLLVLIIFSQRVMSKTRSTKTLPSLMQYSFEREREHEKRIKNKLQTMHELKKLYCLFLLKKTSSAKNLIN